MWWKKFVLIFICVMLIVGCGGGGGSSSSSSSSDDGDETVLMVPVVADIIGYKGFAVISDFMSITADGDVSIDDLTDKDPSLIMVNDINGIEYVIFKNSKGNKVETQVINIVDLDKDYLAIDFWYFNDDTNEYRTALVKKSSGKLINIPGNLPIEDAQLRNGYLYLFDYESGIIYKSDINDLNFIAVNDPNVYFIYDADNYFRHLPPYNYFHSDVRKSQFLVDPNGIVIAIAGPYHSIVLFNSNNPSETPYDTLGSDRLVSVGGGCSSGLVYDGNGIICQLRHVWSGEGQGDYIVKFEFSMTTGISETLSASYGNNVILGIIPCSVSTYIINDIDRYVVFTTGFYKTSMDISGDITMAWTNKTLTELPLSHMDDYDKVQISEDTIYWEYDSKIKKIKLDDISTLIEMIEDINISNFWVIKNKLTYTDGVDTYEVNTPGVKNKIATGNLELVQLIEE